jgi:hypothetical protein
MIHLSLSTSTAQIVLKSFFFYHCFLFVLVCICFKAVGTILVQKRHTGPCPVWSRRPWGEAHCIPWRLWVEVLYLPAGPLVMLLCHYGGRNPGFPLSGVSGGGSFCHALPLALLLVWLWSSVRLSQCLSEAMAALPHLQTERLLPSFVCV